MMLDDSQLYLGLSELFFLHICHESLQHRQNLLQFCKVPQFLSEPDKQQGIHLMGLSSIS